MTNIEQLMPEESNKYEEEWRVILSSKGEYTLSKMQAMIIKQAIASGNRATIMFDTFAIPIPYIVEFYRVKRFLKNNKQLPARASDLLYKPIPKEKWEKLRKEAYNKIGKSI